MTIPKVVVAGTAVEDAYQRDMTEEEFQHFQEVELKLVEREAHLQAELNARQSAIDKLAALGLSPEEIAAITGGN